jgi:thiamine biosynthesis protein ThiS
VYDEELELLVNGETQRVPASCTVTSLLAFLGIGDRRVAVAVNRDVVPRSTFEAHHLSSGDRVEILEAVGGG